MKKKPAPVPATSDLRRQAEAKLSARPPAAAPPANAKHLVHELQVHQIELEMQNDELQRAQAETEALLAQFTDLYDFAPVGYLSLARDGAIRRVNQRAASLLGRESSQLLQRRLGVFVSTSSLPDFNACLERAFASGEKQACEIGLQTPTGQPVWALLEAQTDAARGRGEICQAALSDITERTLASQALRAALAEKEMLVKEVHHRVKNNLQIMVSLLNLQAQRITDPAVLALLKDNRERVHAMALVHEKLYKSPDLAHIQLGAFLRELTQNLRHIYNAPIGVRVEAAEVWLGVDTAIPCGLLANELISNAFKHAFPGGRAGRLQVTLAQWPDPAGDGMRQFHLTIQDDGIGFPAGFNPAETDSLGLHLAHILTRQLQGSLAIHGPPGVRCEILFQERPEQAG